MTIQVLDGTSVLRTVNTLNDLLAVLPAALGAGGGLKIDGSGTAIPVSFTWNGLTDTQLRASAVPVSLASTTITGTVGTTQSGSWNFNQTIGVAGFGKITDGTNTAAVKAASTAAVATDPALVVAISPNGALPVTGTFWQATQPVSGTFWQATQPVSFTWAGLTDTQLRASAVPVSLASTTITGSVAVTGTFWQATQPVSIASMPSTPVTGTFWQATQPVSGTVTLGAGAAAIGSITNTSFIATQATPANLQMSATQVVGSAATRWFAQISDGTNSPAVKAASTAAAATDPALVVSVAGANAAIKIGDGTNNAAIKAASTASAFTDPALTVDVRPGSAIVTAAAALADALANPTLGSQTALSSLFNGSTWDRQRGMSVATTTGDTGAKTATGNGATQTNVGNKGIQIVIAMGVVSGTTPTFVAKVQGSVDGGTNWYDVPGAVTASLVATGVWGISIYPGQAVTAGTTTTGTTATANGILPRTWRIVWTIGGTTPSFTLTSITYNYIPN